MKLLIDNFDGLGAVDYTAGVDGSRLPAIARRLNQPSELRLSLVPSSTDFSAPVSGARITFSLDGGAALFTGYAIEAPGLEHVGWGQTGLVYRFNLVALSDEVILDRKRLPDRTALVARSAGNALDQMSTDLLPGVLDTSSVQGLDTLPSYTADPQKKFSGHAAEIGLRARGAYRAQSGGVSLAPVGATVHTIDESSPDFSPDGLTLSPSDQLINDVTLLGLIEPQDLVRDYFVGDGSTLRFYLSQSPFTRSNRTLFEEEYAGAALNAARWIQTDPSSVVTVSGGKLQVGGGTGSDGQTLVSFAEKLELGGAFILQHGDVLFSAASDGVLGGLYQGTISVAGCVAGFKVTHSGGQSNLQALISGVLNGPLVTTVAGHHYALTTRFYTTQIYRSQQVFHSSVRPSGSPRGGAGIAADVRVVLEVHDIDPANPGSLVAPSTVLFDGIVSNAPGFCSYVLINAASLHCSIAFTRLIQAIDAEVRSAPPGQGYRTRLAGTVIEGAECSITSDPALQFFSSFAPVANELIEVRYRGIGRAQSRVTNPSSIAALAHGSDDGVRSRVRIVQSPPARTSADCENAALAILDDSVNLAWAGDYQTWSDFLPGGADVFPGDAVQINAPSRGAAFSAIVREVDIAVKDFGGEHSRYAIKFANDAAVPLAYEVTTAPHAGALNVVASTTSQVGATFVADLTQVSVASYTSTTITLDTGIAPLAGGGFEVRRSDFGWGPANDRNLVGRFSTQSFVAPRLSRIQDYYLRQYDASSTPKYSRYSAAIHLDYPL
ncbi:MAG TPA: hypothetical protein VH088_10630 [Terriglobales bacterium]|nr:hypothetical protein [Terriglobales bacterium]